MCRVSLALAAMLLSGALNILPPAVWPSPHACSQQQLATIPITNTFQQMSLFPPIPCHDFYPFPLHLLVILLQQYMSSPCTSSSTLLLKAFVMTQFGKGMNSHRWSWEPVWYQKTCVHTCHAPWLGSAYRNKRLWSLVISQRKSVLVLHFAV